MEQRMSMITLGVSDLGKAKAFYENVVGWKAAESPPEIAFFDLGGTVFSLYPHDAMAADIGVGRSVPEGPYHGFGLAHNVRSKDEVDAVFKHLREQGASILKEPEDVFWGGYSGYFSDPDGHAWEVAHNPFWSIGEDGRIMMSA